MDRLLRIYPNVETLSHPADTLTEKEASVETTADNVLVLAQYYNAFQKHNEGSGWLVLVTMVQKSRMLTFEFNRYIPSLWSCDLLFVSCLGCSFALSIFFVRSSSHLLKHM